jgi:hypothetical protein
MSAAAAFAKRSLPFSVFEPAAQPEENPFFFYFKYENSLQ